MPTEGVRLGFIGLGRMGLPMATRLMAAGHKLSVWNRSTRPLELAASQGASVAFNLAELFDVSDVILISLSNEIAIDLVLGRIDDRMQISLNKQTIIQLGTTSPSYSRQLEAAIRANGGQFIEAPVSGSRRPAEDGELVGLIGAANEADYRLAETLLHPLTTKTYRCGEVGEAMSLKLAVNSFLISMVLGLAEAWSFADRLGIDLALFRDVLDAGPMASAVSRSKLEKLCGNQLTAEASIADVLMNAGLISKLAQKVDFPLVLGMQCEKLLDRAVVSGLGEEDMIAVSKVMKSI
jgi:3-hydroxyisobutyrate dehydrogenase